MVPVKLIFVDDDQDDRDLIQDSLLALGAESFLVLDGGQALFTYLNSLNGGPLPDGIVLDHNMPEMSGAQILQKLKKSEHYQKIPVYILTTSSRDDLKQQCIDEGAAGFYTKPNSIVELNSILNELYDTV
jgi:CheY-like chemotaxis protein